MANTADIVVQISTPKSAELSQVESTMTAETWTNGTRVKIMPHAFWPTGGTGTVRPFPALANEIVDQYHKCSRTFDSSNRRLTLVWIVFESPLIDGEGDGPYQEGEIDDLYLVCGRA